MDRQYMYQINLVLNAKHSIPTVIDYCSKKETVINVLYLIFIYFNIIYSGVEEVSFNWLG